MESKKLYISARALLNGSGAFSASVVTIFLLSKGITYVQLGTIWSIYLFTTSITDFPTGNLADILGRKKVFALGSFFHGISQILYGVAQSYLVLIFAAIFAGLASAQISGSLEAWLIDELANKDEKKLAGKCFGDARAYGSVLGIVIGLLIGLFIKEHLAILFYIAGVLYIINALYVLLAANENYGTVKGGIRLTKDAISRFIKSRELRIFGVLLIIYYSLYTIFIFTYQPKTINIGLPTNILGYIHSINLAFMALGSFVAGRLSLKIKPHKLLISAYLIMGVGLLLININSISILLVGISAFFLGNGVFFPIYRAWSNEFIDSSVRASLMSLLSSIASGMNVLIQIFVGWVITTYGMGTILYTGSVMAVFSLYFIYHIIPADNTIKGTF